MVSVEVAADTHVGLDDGLAAEDYMLGAVQLVAARDFVSRVLLRVSCLSVKMGEGRGGIGIQTVSIYSPLMALGGMATCALALG